MVTKQRTEIDKYYTAFEQTLPPKGRTAFKMYQGQVLRVIDVEGQQVADLICFDLNNYDEKISPHNTILMNSTAYLTEGHSLYSTDANKMMTITEDTNGVHDIIAGSCSIGTNRARYGVRGTQTCRTNFEEVLEPFGIEPGEIPYSFNVFMNVPVERDKTAIIEPTSKPGDYIDLRADMDLLVAVSNCPQERNPCNAFKATEMKIVVYETEPTGKADSTSNR